MNKRDYIAVIGIFIIISIVMISLIHGDYLYGSVTDWVTQHYRIPEYFRNLFYETHNLFPNFAFHLGAGQNIYYLSYYGLFSPIILLSYLFPFISMQDYIIIMTIISLFASIFLFYKWIRKKNDTRMTVILTCLFSFATPLLFHSHRHIMFMNYMPFLFMGLFGVDNYFEKNKKSTLIIGIFLMIMTSYFFSVSGIVVIIIYGIMCYMELTSNRSLKSYIKYVFRFMCPVLLAVLMASILLLPTLYTILQGRGEGNYIDVFDLVIPNLSIPNILYSAYSFGLTAILLLSLIIGVRSKQMPIKFISIVLFVIAFIPLFMYILNGGMYINGKVLIPFLPLALLVIANTFKESVIKMKEIIIFIIVSIVIVISNYNDKIVYFFVLDVVLIVFSIFVQNKKRWNLILPVVTILLSFTSMVWSNKNDELARKKVELYENVLSYIESDNSIYRINNLYDNLYSINQVLGNTFYTTSIYSSTSNPYYKDYYNNSIHNEFKYRSREILGTTKNILNNIYLGNKYIIADNYEGLGYEKVYTDKINVYKNEFVFSIGYSTNNIMSEREYNALQYPYNLDALLHYTIVDVPIDDVYQSTVSKVDLEFDIVESDVKYTKKENSYYIISEKDKSRMYIDIKNKELIKDKILLIKFNINNHSSNDRMIKINGITNKVTKDGWKYHNQNYVFEYTLSIEDLSTLEFTFSKGDFDLRNFEFYILDNQDILSLQNKHDEYKIETISGDVIEGNIDVTKNGYFSISIPYDTGFRIYVDRDRIEYEKVNDNFIGFPINEGQHNIRINYISPFFELGKILSIVGFIIFVILVFMEKRNTINRN